MKRLLILLLLLFAVILTACSDTDKDNAPELIIPPGATQTVDETNGIGGFDAVVHSPSPIPST
jgi:hypothetical protein